MVSVGEMLSNFTAAIVGYHASVSPQVKAENSASISDVVMLIFLFSAVGALVYFAIKWHFEIEILRLRLKYRDDEIAFLKRLANERVHAKTLSVDSDAPSVRKCKAMIMMAAQSEGEEGRTAAMLACRFIKNERLEIVAVNKT